MENTTLLFKAVLIRDDGEYTIIRRQGGDLDYVALSDKYGNAVCVPVNLLGEVIASLTAAGNGCPVFKTLTGNAP